MSDKEFGTWESAVSWLMTQPDQQQLVRDCYYDASVNEAATRYYQSPEWSSIQALISSEEGTALDLGAGRGIASFALAKSGWTVSAIEPDPSDLVGAGAIRTLATENALPITVTQGFGEKINFPDRHFDLVVARQVLHHAGDLDQLCSELFRVLKPGGQFVAIRDHVISKPEDLPKFYDVHPLHHLYGGEHAYTFKTYLQAMRTAGFKVEKVLRPFDSVINYAPYTYETLREAMKNRVIRVPILGRISAVLNNDLIFSWLLSVLSRVDNRPGRLFSFVCRKPTI